MQATTLLLILCFSAVVAQNVYNGKNLNANGDSAIGATLYDEDSLLYSVFIPENTEYFNITFATSGATSSDYCYAYVYLKNNGFPCYDIDANTGEFLFCSAYNYVGSISYSDSSATTFSFVPGYNYVSSGTANERVIMPAGGYMFFQVSAQYDSNCGYTVSTSASFCPALSGNNNVVGADYSSYSSVTPSSVYGSQYCAAYTTVPITGSTFQVAATGPIVYKVQLPLGTQYVNVTYTFQTNNTELSPSFYVYATPGQAAGSTQDSNCYEYASNGNTEFFQCSYTPAGNFYIQVVPNGASDTNPSQFSYYGNITITPKVCAAGTLGRNCQAVSFDVSPLLLGQTVSYTVAAGTEAFVYLDVPSAVINTNFSIAYVGEAYFYVSRHFYSDDQSGYGSAGTIGLSSGGRVATHLASFDLNNFFGGFVTNQSQLYLGEVPFRFYLDFECSGSTACPITLSAAVSESQTSATVSSGDVSTASASTASVSTASTPSGSTASVSTASSATTVRVSTASATTVRVSTAAAVSTTTSSASVVCASIAMIVALAMMI